MKNNMMFLKKLIELPYNPGVPLMSEYLKERKSPSQKQYVFCPTNCGIIYKSNHGNNSVPFKS